jgi:hypothetical protein
MNLPRGPSRHRVASPAVVRQHQHRGPFYGVGGFGALLKLVLSVGVRVSSWLSAGATHPVVVGQALSPIQRLLRLLRPLSLRSIFPSSCCSSHQHTQYADQNHNCFCAPLRGPRSCPLSLPPTVSSKAFRASKRLQCITLQVFHVTLRSHVPLCTFCYHVPLRTQLILQLFRCRVFHVTLPSTVRAGTGAYCQSQSCSHPLAAHRRLHSTMPSFVFMYRIHPQSHVRVHHLRTSLQLCGSCRTPAALSSCSFSPSSHSRETAHSCHPSLMLCSCSSSSHCCPLATLAPVVATSDPSYHTATPTAWAHIASLRGHRGPMDSPSPGRH